MSSLTRLVLGASRKGSTRARVVSTPPDSPAANLRWIAAGAIVLIAFIALALQYSASRHSAEQFARRQARIQLVEQMRSALALASEAEKSAVMAITDRESEQHAAEARTATADAETKRHALEQLITTDGSSDQERALWAQFTAAFSNFQRVDQEVLSLAVQNTNLKAYDVLFGPAASTVSQIGRGLKRLADSSPDHRVAVLALGAYLELLEDQALLAPHIAEESGSRMDELEAQLNGHLQEARKDLDELSALPRLKDDPDLQGARSSFDRFLLLQTDIVKLSRENTNVRSVALSLSDKRRALLACEDALVALEAAIQGESLQAVPGRRPVSPR